MNFSARLFLLLAASVLFVMALVYLTNGPVLLMASIFSLLILLSFKINHGLWNIVYLGIFINLIILILSISFTEGKISYLGEEDFYYFYNKVLFIEGIFWLIFISSLTYFSENNFQIKNNRSPLSIGFYKTLYLFVFSLFLIEISISYNSYNFSYIDMPNVGTLVFEVSCLLLAFIILKRGKLNAGSRIWLFELINVGVALFIVYSTGKRLPFSYIMIAYLARILPNYGYLRTGFIYFFIAISAYFFGIFRDFMTLGGLSLSILLDGLYSTNQGAILHASAVYLRVVDENLITILDRLISFSGNFFGAIFVPISFLPEQVQINIFSMQHYPIQGNGGFIGSYAYYFFGWFGPVLLGVLLAWFCSRRGKLIDIIICLVILTSPRWTLYNIGPVVRLIVMVSSTIFLCYIIYKFIFLKRIFPT